MADALSKRIAAADQAIRAGRTADARDFLLSLEGRGVPRPQAADLAGLSRRTYLPELGVRWLHPIVRAADLVASAATDREKAEYAACLARLGAADEAEALLGTLDPKAIPDALLFLHYVNATRWDYAASIPLLERYLATAKIRPYDRLVAKANLADALVYERHHRKAQPLLRELLHETGVRKLFLLQGMVLQVAAMDAFKRGKWDLCERFLEHARRVMEHTDTLDALFLKKWAAFLRLRRDRDLAGLEAVLAIRKEAAAKPHWETVRDCDRALAVDGDDTEVAARVYVGTPYRSFREALRRELGDAWQPPATYRWTLADGTAATGVPELDLRAPPGLKEGQVVHRLLIALAQDFYRPARIATLFTRLYPGEYFNPHTSPARVHAVIGRLREWLGDARLPLDVAAEGGFCFLRARDACAILVASETKAAPRASFLLEKLREKYGEAGFSAGDAMTTLDVSARTARRLLGDAFRDGQLAREGKGVATRYRVKSAA